ncbi:WD40 repeat protein [Sporothrix curviconia]|uniref:WD40 repeat protein n=1 Tax=Sporothrix curviconia TaxID=1260050 RepID=A0ABP0ATZ9_9PEZI
MYWPAATPRVYSTSTSRQAPVPAVTVSYDGLAPPPTPGPSSSPPLGEARPDQQLQLQQQQQQQQQSGRPATLNPDQSQPPRSASIVSLHGQAANQNHDALGLPVPGASPLIPNTPLTPTTPAIKPVEHGFYANDDGPAGYSYPVRHVSPLVLPTTEPVLALRMSRQNHLFATITATSMTIWQAKPTVILAVVVRSDKSLASYGENVDLLFRPDSMIIVVYTRRGYLITYTVATDSVSQVYKSQFTNPTNVQRRRQSHIGDPGHDRPDQILWGPGEGSGIRDYSVRFRMVIKVDAGIESALALDEELIVATTKPAAVQCIRWARDGSNNQTSTELLSKMGWLDKKVTVREMTHDKPMSLSTWVISDGKAYAVQRNANPPALAPAPARAPQFSANDASSAHSAASSSSASTPPPAAPATPEVPLATVVAASTPTSGSGTATPPPSSHKKLFRGHCFHVPKSEDEHAMRATINARFSLIAVGCVDGIVRVYSVKDYAGNVPFSHVYRPPVSVLTTGRLTKMAYSPDGYCLFAGYENGWATWSVYGKPLGHSFNGERTMADNNSEDWLSGVRDVSWMGNSGDVLLVTKENPSIWLLEMARSAAAGCYSPANLFRTVLHTNQNIMVYRGYDLPDLTTISAEPSLWHTARIPATYLVNQWPIRCTVISSDGRYVAVAGRRGLAHYSIGSGRWRTFANVATENEFTVRGGMCWYQNLLVAAVEVDRSYELRLYPREALLDNSSIVFREPMRSPIVLITPSGDDSLLVYTYENILYHYIFVPTSNGSVRLMQMGHIGFHGIVRSPARVRGLSWVLPESQLYGGDPSMDVAMASVLVLVDGKLVLFQPSCNEEGARKYDMRIIAQSVEFYVCMKDQPFSFLPAAATQTPTAPGAAASDETLQKSLWLFDGGELKLWTDTHEVLEAVVTSGNVAPPITIDLDFYPLSILLSKALVLGVEPELVQRRDVSFSFFRYTIRTHLFLPDVLRAYLGENKALPALRLAQQYQHLAYFAHALEVLLHQVLDEEVDSAPKPEAAVLPRVLSLLSSFRAYLDIVVQCTRKTEVRSWRTLFAYLPPPQELFEESLLRGSLKTAGGYLLILHTFDELATASEQGVRLLRQAMHEGDWELCKELARFLAAMDDSGQTLREALALANAASGPEGGGGENGGNGVHHSPSSSTLALGNSRLSSNASEALNPTTSSSHLAVPRRNGNTSQSESDALSTSDDGSSIDSGTVGGH